MPDGRRRRGCAASGPRAPAVAVIHGITAGRRRGRPSPNQRAGLGGRLPGLRLPARAARQTSTRGRVRPAVAEDVRPASLGRRRECVTRYYRAPPDDRLNLAALRRERLGARSGRTPPGGRPRRAGVIAAYNATAGRGNGRSAEFIADDIEALQDIYGGWPGTDRVHPHDITIARTYGREYDDLFGTNQRRNRGVSLCSGAGQRRAARIHERLKCVH